MSVEKRYETGLSDDLGARVPREFTRADLVSKIRSALDAQVISNDYAQTLTDLVEILAKESR